MDDPQTYFQSLIIRVGFLATVVASVRYLAVGDTPRGFIIAVFSVCVLSMGYMSYLFSRPSNREGYVLAIAGNLLPFLGLTVGLWLELYPYLWVDLWALYQYENALILLWTVALISLGVSCLVMWEILGVLTYLLTPRLERFGGTDSIDLYKKPPKILKPFVDE